MADLVPVVQYCVREYTTPEAMMAFLILESYVELKKQQAAGFSAQHVYRQDEKRRFLLALFSVVTDSNMSQSVPNLVSTLQHNHRNRVIEALTSMRDRMTTLCDRLLAVARYDEKEKEFKELQRFFTMSSYAGVFFRRVIVAFNASSFEQVAALQRRLLDYAAQLSLLNPTRNDTGRSRVGTKPDSGVGATQEASVLDSAQSLRTLNWTAAIESAHRHFDIQQQGASTRDDFINLLRNHNNVIGNADSSSTSLNASAVNQARANTLMAFTTLSRARSRRACRFGMLQHAAIAHVFGFHERAAACLAEARRYAAKCADAAFATLVREWSSAILQSDSSGHDLEPTSDDDDDATSKSTVQSTSSSPQSLAYPHNAVTRLLDAFGTRWTNSFSTTTPPDSTAADYAQQQLASSALSWTVVGFPAVPEDTPRTDTPDSATPRDASSRCCVGESACRFSRVRLIVQLYASLCSLWDTRGHRFMQLACAHCIIALCECASPADETRALGRTDRKLCAACAASVHIMRVFALAIFVRAYASMCDFSRASQLMAVVRERLVQSFADDASDVRGETQAHLLGESVCEETTQPDSRPHSALFENVPVAIGVRHCAELLEKTFFESILERELAQSCLVSSTIEQALANLRLFDQREAELRTAWLRIRTGEHQAAFDSLNTLAASQPNSRHTDAVIVRVRILILRAELFVRVRSTADARKCLATVERLAKRHALTQFSVATRLLESHCSVVENRVEDALRTISDTLQHCAAWTLSDNAVTGRLVHTLAVCMMEQFRLQNWNFQKQSADSTATAATVSCPCQLASILQLLEHVRQQLTRSERPCPVLLVRTLVHQATVYDWLGKRSLRDAKAREAKRYYLDNVACFNSDVAIRPAVSDSACLIDFVSY